MPKLLPFETFKTCFGGNVEKGEVEKAAFKGKIKRTSRETRSLNEKSVNQIVNYFLQVKNQKVGARQD